LIGGGLALIAQTFECASIEEYAKTFHNNYKGRKHATEKIRGGGGQTELEKEQRP